MSFITIYLWALPITIGMMSLIWIVSVFKKNAGIVDIFWGTGFVLLSGYYFLFTGGYMVRKIILLTLVFIWGMRLSIHILTRNWGKGEDFRYREFRRKYGPDRYWWVSFFQTFVLQGLLMWLISAPLLGAQYYSAHNNFGIGDGLAVAVWLLGFVFEAGGDFQLVRFKKNPDNRGKVLNTGFWKYTRHPNYFGDSCVWWGYAIFSIAGGSFIPVYGSILMTILIIRVSGVMLLEKSLKQNKPGYREYVEKTSAFFPRPPHTRGRSATAPS